MARGLAAFERHPRAAVVNFMIVWPDGTLSRRDWCHPRDPDRWADTEFETSYVLEGVSACRREAFFAAGGYWPPYFIGHEGLDLGLRRLGAGHEIIYSPFVRVAHLVEPSARPSSRIFYTFTRNAIWVALRNHRPGTAAIPLAQDLALMAFCAARSGQLGAFARGLADGLRGAGRALRTPRPLSAEAYRRLRAINALRPRPARRALRHVRERLI